MYISKGVTGVFAVALCILLIPFLTGAVSADEFTKANQDRWQQEFMSVVRTGDDFP